MQNKKVSIIMAIANTDYPVAHYTGNTIGSIKDYTDPTVTPYELIVVDNGSTVELGGVVWSELCDKYIRNETNLGVSKAWNQGIKAATGDYICIVNSDIQVFDFWLEDLLDSLKYVDLAMAYPMYDAPYARGQEAFKRREVWAAKKPSEYLKDFHDFSCVVGSKQVFEVVGPFNETINLAYSEDTDFKMRMRVKRMVFKADHRVNIHHVASATSYTLKKQNLIDLNKIMDENKKYVKDLWDIDEFGVPGFVRNKQYEDRPFELPELLPDGSESVGVAESEFTSQIQEKVDELLKDAPKAQILPDVEYCVRTKNTGDKVYFVKDNTASWIKNPESLAALGFRFSDVQMMNHAEFLKLDRGEPIDVKLTEVEANDTTVSGPEQTVTTNPVMGYREMA